MKALFVGGYRHGQVLEVPDRRDYKVPVPPPNPHAETSIQVYRHQTYVFLVGAIDLFVLDGECELSDLIDALATASKLDIRRRGDGS